ncbi:MAG: HRDC domain-containing protein [Planctomycetaceae bacterium]|nr:HRDC domain-containing protein [Planctomycetaceae bacterium]
MSHIIVEEPTHLAAMLDSLRGTETVSLDMEADSFHHYRPKVCLIQITIDHQNYIVDPLADIEMGPFLTILSEKNLIIHDAGYDLRMLLGDFGFVPKAPVFDTMLAAGLAGMKNVGLSAMMHEVVGVPTVKRYQKADWSRRPLPDYLLEYAAVDTQCLLEIKKYLEERLNQLGRLAWHEESCRASVRQALTAKEPPVEEDQWRIKASGVLKPREMAFLRQLWTWRDRMARKTNIAPFMILRNEDLLKLAAWGAHRRKPVEDDKEFPVRHARRYSKALIDELKAAQALPPQQWPGPRRSDPSKKLSEKVRRVVNLLKDECETIAQGLNLPLNLIASRQALTRIVLNHAVTLEEIRKNEILLNWQANLLLPAIQRVLN